MSTILITGASGYLGKALAAALAARHTVLCLSRRNPGVAGTTWLRGDFAAYEDLRQLDAHPCDAVIHLAAVTGGCLERDGMLVNVEGTRVLMRYLIDRGCRKFVMASSIAVVGMQDPGFRPLALPVADEHLCLDRDGYGFSKYMMEELTRYYVRQNPAIDVLNLRLAAIVPDDAQPGGLAPLGAWALGSVSCMLLADALRLFTLAVEAPLKPGLRIANATCAEAWTRVPTAELLRHWWGDAVDLSHYDAPANAHASAYDVRRVKAELGFEASATLAVLAAARNAG